MSDGWNPKTLKAYVDARFNAIEKATDDSAAAMSRRLDGMNEFRDSLRDQAAHFLPIDTYNAQHQALDDKVNVVASRATILEARALGSAALFGYLIAVVTAVAAIASVIIILARR